MNKLSGNKLKVIALISMTVDHVGKAFFSSNIWFEIIGRLSFPIFAYMIAEGWKYTSNRKRYMCTIWGMGILYQIVYYFLYSSLYMGIFITYGLSLLLIYAIESLVKKKKYCFIVSPIIILGLVFVGCIENVFPNSGFAIDYGLVGICIPALVYFGKTKKEKVCFLFLGLCCLYLVFKGLQFISLLSTILLAFYSEKRGNKNLKYFFYFYYPFHLVAIWFIQLIINNR